MNDLRHWIDVVTETHLLREAFETPTVLYHGTKPKLLNRIKRQGLLASKDDSWQEFGAGIYLALREDDARQYGSLVFAVDVSQLNERQLVADDFELKDYFQGAWGEGDEGDYEEDEGRPTGIYEATWVDSLRISGQCQYLGDIPSSALTVTKAPKDDREQYKVDFQFPNGEQESRVFVGDETSARRQATNYFNNDPRQNPRIVKVTLQEAVGPNVLYHGTDIQRAARILHQDKIIAATDHRINGQTVTGVSLTRSFRFAVDWKRFGAIFTLDGDRLRNRHKIIPVDYYTDRHEHEEFVIGSIAPLSRVLTGITITPETAAWCREEDEKLIEGHKDYEDLLNHPLLTIQNFPQPVPYVNPRKPGTGRFDQTPPNG